ncbi:hypothetical protein [Pseudomonas caspiana]|uniref:Uncharacterized protein n=1 Tax=Pseudomonas caspiana TaxID=1451454 RepID=A0A1Y3PA36_9PSED|nr:hypothetical protein [Pseudomonas caspiana]OUM74423.1 hypothetical protein AUC60_06635 [Pseudomonas caspiana]
MQAQHLIVIAVLMPISWAALGYLVWRAVVRIERRHAHQATIDLSAKHAEHAQQLHSEIERLLEQHRDLDLIKTAQFTHSDRIQLIAASQTLELAARTWRGLRATDQADKATAHQYLLKQFSARIRETLHALNTTDTTLITHTRSSAKPDEECFDRLLEAK